jgi:thiol:disulfide interchange protein DsbD
MTTNSQFQMTKKIFSPLIFALIFLSNQSSSQVLAPVKWAFAVKQNGVDAELRATATIESGWHLYGQFFPDGGPIRMEFKFVPSPNYKTIGKVSEMPAPQKEQDEIFGIEVQYFEKNAVFSQKIKILSEKDFEITGELSGQACEKSGRCVQTSQAFSFNIKGAKQNDKKVSENVIKTDSVKIPENKKVKDSVKTVNQIVRSKTTPILAKNNPWKNEENSEGTSLFWFFLVALGFGLTALVTPCVFPMIPMTVSFFMNSSENRKKSRMNALLYGVSIVLIYTLPIALIIGIANIAGKDSVSGDFANFLSTHWIPNIFFFLIFVVFAASFFGMFEIVLPNWLVSKSDKQADKGGLIGVFFMAFTLVLVSFSCTGPIVGGILVESTQGGHFLKPIIGMLGFSIGVAMPFTVFAFFPEMLKKLPKSGGWLNSVKVVLGFLELALGLKFLSVADQTYHWRLLDREIYIAIWITIFTLMGLYLLGKLKFAHDSEIPFLKVPRLIFAIITFTFVVYLIPGMFGAPLKALAGYLPPQATHDFDLMKMIRGESASDLCDIPKYGEELHLPHGLNGYFDYYQALECSQEQKKPIFIDFTGHGCVNCREMEANVWSDPKVLKILKDDYIILALYVDDKKIQIPEKEWFTSTYDNELKKSLGKQNADIQIVNFNKNSQPYYVLLDSKGNVLAQPHAYDLNVEHFVKFLENGKKKFKELNR